MNKGLDRNNTTTVPYGPATGVTDPGRQPVVDDTPYAGDHGPGGVHTPGYVPDSTSPAPAVIASKSAPLPPIPKATYTSPMFPSYSGTYNPYYKYHIPYFL